MKRLKKGKDLFFFLYFLYIYLDRHFQIVYSFISFHNFFFNVFDIAIKLSFGVYLAYKFKLVLHLTFKVGL